MGAIWPFGTEEGMEYAAIFGWVVAIGLAILAVLGWRAGRRARHRLEDVSGQLATARAALRELRAQADSERTIAERERALVRDLRELGDLKDALLADRAAEIEERERLISELKVSNAELARFNYTVSHDLKNPLVTIKNFLGLLRHDAATGRADRLDHDIDRIAAAADRMERLLEELLELTRVGRPVELARDVDMGELVSWAFKELRGPIAERGVRVEAPPDLPVVRGDRERLEELIRNLIDNGIRYMGDQPAPLIEIGCRLDEPGNPVLYVRDNGLGIESRYQEKVFDLFQRLDTGTEGTGIGLTLAKRIVEVHGGRIWVESEGAGHGSTFCFTIPGDG